MTKKQLPKITEHMHQASVIEWATVMRGQYPELDYLFAIPNGAKLPWTTNKDGNRYSPEANKLTAEGLRSGVPDLCLPVPRFSYHGMYIEMKAKDGKATPEQIEYLNFLAGQGYFACVCFGAVNATDMLQWYLDLPAFGSTSFISPPFIPIPSGVFVAPFAEDDQRI